MQADVPADRAGAQAEAQPVKGREQAGYKEGTSRGTGRGQPGRGRQQPGRPGPAVRCGMRSPELPVPPPAAAPEPAPAGAGPGRPRAAQLRFRFALLCRGRLGPEPARNGLSPDRRPRRDGEGSEHRPPQPPSMAPRLLGPVGWGSAAVLGLLTGVVFVLVLIPAKDAVLPTRIKYGLVFDAGSTHTSLYIYRWPADKENDTGIVSQVEACSVAGPGISSYADDPAGAGAGLKPCLDRAMKIVPAEQQRETPTYLGATAGMRLLREENSTKAEQVLAEVSKAIGEYPVDFRGARILTGSEEGSFGWITVNYLLETLVKFSFAEKWAHPQDTEVLGALDLGGASTQITFQPGVPVEDRNTSVFFRLYGTDYSLYSHSYLCYGQSQALKMLLAALHQASSRAQISHPCYPKGYKETITVAELYNSPCVRAPSSARPGLVLTVTGTGDTDTCHAAVQRLFDFSCGAQGPCGFNGVYQPPVRGHFFAFSGFYHSLHFLNLTGGQSLSLVNATIRKICNSSWKQVQELFPTASRTQIRDACTASSYTLTLLLQGYKFNVTTWPNIHFIRQVANTDVGWTLGYMLNLTNMIPSEPPPAVVGLLRSIWIAATVLLAIMLLLSSCLLTATCCQRDSSGYEQL